MEDFEAAHRLTEAAAKIAKDMGGDVVETAIVTRSQRGKLDRPHVQIVVRLPHPDEEAEPDITPTEDQLFRELTEELSLDMAIDEGIENIRASKDAQTRLDEAVADLGDLLDEDER